MHTDSPSIASQVEDGTYFIAARKWYSELFHTPIAQRSYYIFVILLSLINVYFAVLSFTGVFPISVRVPFVTYSNDVTQDIPRIKRISSFKSEDKNLAVMKFLVRSYVINRESYDLSLFELRYRNIWSQSSKEAFEEYKKQIDASNPYSFYRMYTNRARRSIDIQSVNIEHGKDALIAHVVFEAPVTLLSSGSRIGTSKWRADFTYQYTDFAVDQSLDTHNAVARFFGLTGNALRVSGERRKVVPMTFVVSDYKVKELLE